MIFDYMIDLNTFNYHEWDTLVPKTEQLIKEENLQGVIPTVDIVRYSFLITAVLIHKIPVLLTGMSLLSTGRRDRMSSPPGNSGVGKTQLIESMLRSLTLPDGNVVRPGTILGDVLQYNAARNAMASKFAQAGDSTLESSTSSGKTITRDDDDDGDLDL